MNTARRGARLTRRGKAALVGGVCVLVAGSFLRVGEMIAVGVAGTVLPPIALVRVRRASRRVDVEVELSHEPPRPVRGRLTTIRAQIRNVGKGTLVARATVEAAFVEEPPSATIRIRRDDVAEVVGTSEAWRRGRHKVGPVVVEVGDGAGLAVSSWSESTTTETLVLPWFNPIEGAPTLPPEERAAGRTRRSPMRGTEFHSLREYQRGDDLRQVHWRASARHGSLLVRELEPLALPRFTVVLDDRRSAYEDPRLFELAVSTATSVVAGLGQRGFGVRLVTSDAKVGPHAYGSGAVERLVERLALVEPTPIATLVEAVRRSLPPGRGGGIVLVAPTTLDPATLAVTAKVAARYGFAGAMLAGASGGGADVVLMSRGWRVVRLASTNNALLDRRVPVEAWRKLLQRDR